MGYLMELFSFRNLFTRKSGSRDRRARARQDSSNRQTILVVDDSKTIVFTLKKILEQDGYSTLVASNGKEAIHMARKHSPDLILMDVIMPGINGFRATRMLKSDESTSDIPIIMMSGDTQAMQEFWVNKIGAKDFLNKPFKRGDVFEKIEKFIRQIQVA